MADFAFPPYMNRKPPGRDWRGAGYGDDNTAVKAVQEGKKPAAFVHKDAAAKADPSLTVRQTSESDTTTNHHVYKPENKPYSDAWSRAQKMHQEGKISHLNREAREGIAAGYPKMAIQMYVDSHKK